MRKFTIKFIVASILIGILLYGFVFRLDNVAIAEAPRPTVEEIHEVEEYLKEMAELHSISFSLMEYIVEHESGFYPLARGDMHLICPVENSPFYGQPIEARGLWQITKCYWPDITDEQAYDPIWSTNWAISQLKMGSERCKALWTTCRWYYGEK